MLKSITHISDKVSMHDKSEILSQYHPLCHIDEKREKSIRKMKSKSKYVVLTDLKAVNLTPCMLGNFTCFFVVSVFFN